MNILWKKDSIYLDQNVSYTPDGEILSFYPDGKYTRFWLNKLNYLDGWSLDKGTSPATITYGGRSPKIEKIDEKSFIFSYVNEFQNKVTYVYSNHGYK